MRCLACGEETAGRAWRGVGDYEYGAYRPVSYISCSRCRVIVQSPLPPAELIPSFYPPDYRNRLIVKSGLFYFLKRAQTRWLARRLGRYIGGTGKKVLELGYGSGELLLALHWLGFRNLAGADFDDAGAAHLEDRGIRFRRANMEEGFPFSEQFDCVIMVNVIEHFLDPVGVLSRIRERLAPGGIVILITPNAAALELLLFGRFWSGFHAPRHIWLFSRDGFVRLGRSLGFALTTVRPAADPGQWAISIQNMFQATRVCRSRLSSGLAWYTVYLSVLAAPLAWLQNLWLGRSTTIFAVLRRDETKNGDGGL